MKIEYLGHSCFRLITKNGTCIVTDPYSGVGYELPDGILTDIATISHGHFDHNHVSGLRNARIVLEKPEKYVYDDVVIDGFLCNHDEKGGALRGKNVVYTIRADAISVCHFGDLGEACNENLLAKIGKPDVLLIPVGGTYTIDSAQAKEYVEKLNPKLVIPMHYKPADGTLDITDEKPFLALFDKVVYAPKNAVIEVEEYIKDKTQVLFMERMGV